MRKEFRCRRGHQWEASIGERGLAQLRGVLCPVCGAAAESLGEPRTSSEAEEAPHSRDTEEWLPVVADHELLEELGRGGMGVVYKARQVKLNRLVALKVVRTVHPLARGELSRFLAEAEAIARLQHPNIVQIFEVGEHRGRPYQCLEYVSGGSLAAKLAGAPQSPLAAAHLVEILARAMHHAHQRGIVHRDLKPANVLLDDQGAPRITDFGLAKLLDADAGQTHTGVILGTPCYMAPEQASGRAHCVSPVTDVYALGAILYEMLTGRPPFRGLTPLETLEQVRSQEVVSPRRLQPSVHRDLETICLKCLNKLARQRYPTALELADDLRRFQEKRPIRARPLDLAGRLVRSERRAPTVAVLLAVSVLAGLALLAGSLTYLHQLRRLNGELGAAVEREQELALEADWQRRAAREREDLARRHLYVVQIRAAQQAHDHGQIARALDILNGLRPRQGKPDTRGLEWHYLWQCHRASHLLLHGHKAQPILGLAFTAKGDILASGGVDGTVRLWDVHRGQLRTLLEGHRQPVTCLAISPDGRTVVSATRGPDGPGELKRWDAARGKEAAGLPAPPRFPIGCLVFSPDGKYLAAAGDEPGRRTEVWLWNLASGEAPTSLPTESGSVWSLVFSPDSRFLAVPGNAGDVRLWNLATRKVECVLRGRKGTPLAIAFSPDGRLLAVGEEETVRVWDLATWREGASRPPLRATLHERKGCHVWFIAFSNANCSLITAAGEFNVRKRNSLLKRWDLASRKELPQYAPPLEGIDSLALTTDGRTLALGGGDGIIRLLDLRAEPVGADLRHKSKVWGVAFSADGKMLASAGADATTRLWDGGTGSPLGVLAGKGGEVNAVAFSPDGSTLASGNDDGSLSLWDVASRSCRKVLRGHRGNVLCVASSPDGRALASGGEDGIVRVWDIQTGQVRWAERGHAGWVRAVAFTPDGRTLASSGQDSTIRLWDASGKRRRTITDTREVLCLAFSHDGKTLASGGVSEVVNLWDVATGQRQSALAGHVDKVRGLAFGPKGMVLASGSADGTVKLWDLRTRLAMVTMHAGRHEVTAVAFGPDGRSLAAAGYDGRVWLWQAPR